MQIARRLPFAEWVPNYDRSWFRSDLIAGLTVWALVVPQAIAYAQIAGLPPQAGVFASFAAPLGYALFGTSRQLVCSPTSATAAISAALIAPVVIDRPEDFAAMSAALAILSGICFFILGKLKLGFISQFIASGVQIGFLFGLGMTIIVGQLFAIFGIPKADGPFYRQAWQLITNLDETSGWTLVLGTTAFVAVFLLGKKMPTVPAALLLVAISILVVTILDLAEKGVAVVGDVDRAFPTPAIPMVDIGTLLTLIPGALAIVVVGYSESISIAKRFADEHHYQIQPDRELTALGISSALSGLFQGFITSGGASQSAANDRAGAKSQMSSIVLGLLAALTSILLMPLFKNLPVAVLAAIVINAVLDFVNIPAMRRLSGLRRESFLLALLALIGVLVLGILPGLLIAVVISLLLLLSRISRPTLSTVAIIPGTDAVVALSSHPEAEQRPGLLMLRPDLPLLFTNASWIRENVVAAIEEASPQPTVVVLDLEDSYNLDIGGVEALEAIDRDLADRGITLWLSNFHVPAQELFDRSRAGKSGRSIRIFPSVRQVVQAFDDSENARETLDV